MKIELNGATGDTSNLTAKSYLASLKPEVNEIDTDQLMSVPADWSKLGNLVSNDIFKKAEHNKLITKVNAIDSIHFENSIQ